MSARPSTAASSASTPKPTSKTHDAWEAHDASYTDGLHTSGFYGGAFDGRYVYFNPRDDGTVHHSRLLRYDTQADFKDPDAWAAHDAQLSHSGQGLAFDGQYLYFCPGYTRSSTGGLDNENSGHILRYDTRAPLKDSESYTVFNAQQLHPEAACFDGAAFDGRHIYFAPLSSGHVLRYAVAGDFADPQSWDLYDARPLGDADERRCRVRRAAHLFLLLRQQHNAALRHGRAI